MRIFLLFIHLSVYGVTSVYGLTLAAMQSPLSSQPRLAGFTASSDHRRLTTAQEPIANNPIVDGSSSQGQQSGRADKISAVQVNQSGLATIKTHHQKPIKIKLVIDKAKTCQVYLSQWFSNDSIQPLDTAQYRQPGIEFKRPITEPAIYQLTFNKTETKILFIADADMSIRTTLTDPPALTIQGSPLTKEWEEFNQKVADQARMQMIEIYQKKEKAEKEGNTQLVAELERENGQANLLYDQQVGEYIWDHPASFVSVFLLSKIPQNRRRHYFEHLTEPMKNTSLARYIMLPVVEEETVGEGSQVAAFEKTDLNGNPISAQSLKGSYTLIDFWGTWCGPCLALLPQMRIQYARYKDSPVKWVSVACEFDSSEQKVQQIISREQLVWTHLIENRSNPGKESLIKLFAINAYPTTLVIDPQGTILYRGSGKEGFLEACQTLDQHLNKEHQRK